MALRSTTNTAELYFVASTARSKLGKEACRESHRLRLLVGHANLLDGLMVELNQIKNEPVCGSRRSSQEPEEMPELQDDSGDSSDDDSEDELVLSRCPVRSSAPVRPVATAELNPQLRLNEATRTSQRQHFSPSLDSVIETEANMAYDRALDSTSLPTSNIASHAVVDPTSKIAQEIQPSIPGAPTESSGGKQRSTTRGSRSGRTALRRKR